MRLGLAVAALFLAGGRAQVFGQLVTGASANKVVGQSDFQRHGQNGALGTSAATLQNPAGIWTDGSRLIVADKYNHRILIWNSMPASDSVPADVVVGQPNMSLNGYWGGAGSLGAGTLAYPSGVAFDGTRLFVADTNNNRVLIWNSLPTSDNAPADVVVGQANMSGSGYNQGAWGTPPAANTLAYPSDVHSDGTRLFIADSYNNRVLIYNSRAPDMALEFMEQKRPRSVTAAESPGT